MTLGVRRSAFDVLRVAIYVLRPPFALLVTFDRLVEGGWGIRDEVKTVRMVRTVRAVHGVLVRTVHEVREVLVHEVREVLVREVREVHRALELCTRRTV